MLEKWRKQDSVGQFEQFVLTAESGSFRDDAYSVSIHAKVAERRGRRVSRFGAVYVTLDRLEDKGLVASWLSEPTAERGGRSKRCYRLEALGERALEESAVTARRILDVVLEAWGGELQRGRGKRWGKNDRDEDSRSGQDGGGRGCLLCPASVPGECWAICTSGTVLRANTGSTRFESFHW